MKAVSHPNIVQYLGIKTDPETGLPVLLMELMDYSLTHSVLESAQCSISYYIQVNFCHDITRAISYLHSNVITHKDLSSTFNGLWNPQASRVSYTMCPGTETYMPPEAVKEPPIYTAKIDCFSIGRSTYHPDHDQKVV